MIDEIYQKKLGLCRQLRQVTEDMVQLQPDKLVNEDRASEQMLRLLAERDGIIEQIDELDLELVGRDEAGTDGLRDAIRAELLKVQELNGQLEQVLQDSLAQLRAEVKKVKDGRQSQRAYFARASAEGAFIDKRR